MTVLPQALDFWQKALKVRPLRVPIKLSRKCPDNKIFFPPSIKPFHQHCIEQCLNITTCGEVVVPQDHLDVRGNMGILSILLNHCSISGLSSMQSTGYGVSRG